MSKWHIHPKTFFGWQGGWHIYIYIRGYLCAYFFAYISHTASTQPSLMCANGASSRARCASRRGRIGVANARAALSPRPLLLLPLSLSLLLQKGKKDTGEQEREPFTYPLIIFLEVPTGPLLASAKIKLSSQACMLRL